MPFLQEIEVDGVLRDLSHLQEFIVDIPGKGKDGGVLRVKVSIGSHCVSKSCDFADCDIVDENGKPRKFCEDRYAFSLGLPELAKRMIDQNYYCWESKDRNRAINYAVVDVAPGRIMSLNDGEHQVVFFYIYPSTAETSDVTLAITSCHLRFISFSQIKRRYNLHVQLRACLYKQKRVP